MTTSTTLTDPKDFGTYLYADPLTITGPDEFGVWTITVPDDISQEILDHVIAEMTLDANKAANAADLLAKAAAALTSNATFLALAAPTQAQSLTQIKSLTRQMNALIKLLSRDLNDTSGT